MLVSYRLRGSDAPWRPEIMREQAVIDVSTYGSRESRETRRGVMKGEQRILRIT